MIGSKFLHTSAARVRPRSLAAMIVLLAAVAGSSPAALAQSPPGPVPLDARVVVVGEGSVSVAADLAQIWTGVTTRAKTVKEATDTNSKTMAAIMATLAESGIAPQDIQTARFTVQPAYAASEPRTEQKLVGYSVVNQLSVKIHQIDKVGQILDRLVAAGATDVANVHFLVAEPSKAADQAREAAIADARRKAEVYAHAAGVELGKVVFVAEDSGAAGPGRDFAGVGGDVVFRREVPILSGEDVLHARVTVGFDLAH
jgi:uncharacterized protein